MLETPLYIEDPTTRLKFLRRYYIDAVNTSIYWRDIYRFELLLARKQQLGLL